MYDIQKEWFYSSYTYHIDKTIILIIIECLTTTIKTKIIIFQNFQKFILFKYLKVYTLLNV